MSPTPIPMTCPQTIELYFLEHRAKLVDLAAFLDRVERAPATGAGRDFRMAALERCLAILTDGQPERAKRVLEALSDPSEAPVAAAGMKGAFGAYAGG